MTTTLRGAATNFLPFNKGGADGGSGNPPVDDSPECYGIRTHYMLHEIWTRESITDVLLNYMHTNVDVASVNLEESADEVDIFFPRYHQLRFVRRTVGALRGGSTERSFLAQHSAGSGKTLTIAWEAHQVVRLVNERGAAMFDHVLVVTDRIAVARQLQKSVDQLNKHEGLVAHVRSTKELVNALIENKRIIVSTVQKFSYVKKMLRQLEGAADKRFFVMVDEAHSGQTGQNAASIVDVLGHGLLDELADNDFADVTNIVYAAFTATPKPDTLAKFGESGVRPHDVYSMKQAIEEGYILNVLSNYVAYSIGSEIRNTGADALLRNEAEARRQLSSHVRSSAAVIEHVSSVVLEHMVTNTLPNIGGWGRGMLVVTSREEVHKFVVELRRQIAANPDRYASVKPMGAYTSHLDIDGERVEDRHLNGFSDTEIPSRLAKAPDDPGMYNLLVAADKYQTGFDEPLLCTMYVNKKLHGVSAVQTTSRINRIRRQNDKHQVTVVDFQDNEEEVRAAFRQYGVESRRKTPATTQSLTDTANTIYSYGFFTRTQMDEYHEKSLVTDEATAAAFIRTLVDDAHDKAASHRDSADVDDQAFYSTFTSEANRFVDDFVFVSQFKHIHNTNLQGLYGFLPLLLRSLSSDTARTADTEWLDSLDISVTLTEEESSNINPLLGVTGEGDDDSEDWGWLNPLDSTAITVNQLIEQLNERLRRYLAAALGINCDNVRVLDRIVEKAAANPTLRGYAENCASNEFDTDNTRKVIHSVALLALVEDKKDNSSTPGFVDLCALFSNDPRFKDRVLRYALAGTYRAVRETTTETPHLPATTN
jgi:type I restriction enzyme, R subunit